MRNLGRWIFFRHPPGPFDTLLPLLSFPTRSAQPRAAGAGRLGLGSSSCPGARRSGSGTYSVLVGEGICHLVYDDTATFLRSCHKWNKPPTRLLVGPTDGQRLRRLVWNWNPAVDKTPNDSGWTAGAGQDWTSPARNHGDDEPSHATYYARPDRTAAAAGSGRNCGCGRGPGRPAGFDLTTRRSRPARGAAVPRPGLGGRPGERARVRTGQAACAVGGRLSGRGGERRACSMLYCTVHCCVRACGVPRLRFVSPGRMMLFLPRPRPVVGAPKACDRGAHLAASVTATASTKGYRLHARMAALVAGGRFPIPRTCDGGESR